MIIRMKIKSSSVFDGISAKPASSHVFKTSVIQLNVKHYNNSEWMNSSGKTVLLLLLFFLIRCFCISAVMLTNSMDKICTILVL